MITPAPGQLILPLARMAGRTPTVSHEFEGRTHEGLDLGWHWEPGDPTDPVHRNHRGRGSWVTLQGARWRAAAPGRILYAEARKRGYTVRLRTPYGYDILYMHGQVGSLHLGLRLHIEEGESLALVGPDQTDPEGWAHLHFEIRVPAREGTEGRDGYGCVPVDPWPFLRVARVIDEPGNPSV